MLRYDKTEADLQCIVPAPKRRVNNHIQRKLDKISTDHSENAISTGILAAIVRRLIIICSRFVPDKKKSGFIL